MHLYNKIKAFMLLRFRQRDSLPSANVSESIMKDLYIIDRRFVLKAKIKALAVEIATLKSQKRKIFQYARCLNDTPDVQLDQRILAKHLGELAPSDQARYTLLAYAYIRDKPYALAEQKTRDGVLPPAGKIAEIAFAACPPWSSDPKARLIHDQYAVRISEWLKAPAVVETAARQAA